MKLLGYLMDRPVGNPEQCSPPSSSQAGERPTRHHGLESDSSVSTSIDSSDYRSQVALHQMIQSWPSLESPSPMRLRASKSKQNAGNSKNKKRSKNKNKNKNCTNSEKNRSCTAEVCTCAASFTADCAAICCCPCAIVHLLILAFVRVPSTFARKALCYARKKAALHCSNLKRPADHKDDHDDENDRGRYSFSPWSNTESPATTDGSPPPPKFDTQKLWTELYEAGYMGFGGPPFHWNNNHDDENDDDDACFHSSKADSLPRVSNS